MTNETNFSQNNFLKILGFIFFLIIFNQAEIWNNKKEDRFFQILTLEILPFLENTGL